MRPEVSDEENPEAGDRVGRIDDPDWVDQIVARALAKAEGTVRAAALEADTKADPGSTSRSVAEVAADAATRQGDRPAPARTATPTEPPMTPEAPTSTVPPVPTAAVPPAPAARPAPTADLGGGPAAAALHGSPETKADGPAPTGDPTAATVFDDLLVDEHDPDEPGSDPGAEADPDAEDEDDDSGGSAMRSIVEWGAVIVGALVVAFLIKTFLLQAFFIPSGSMEPTLNIGDRVLVNKLAYDFHDVNRGDLVVFDRPANESGGVPDLIKRVIALSGETIQFRDGIIYVDNRRLDEPYQPPGFQTSGLSLTNAGAALCGGADVCTVPEGHVFVMGDNRNDSRDSRFFGPIPEDAIIGRAFLRVWPLDNIDFL